MTETDLTLDRTVVLCVAGSRAYGMARPDSDVDLRGVFAPSRRVVHGFVERIESVDDPARLARFFGRLTPAEQEVASATKLEGSVHELRRFVSLAAEANPNLLDVLFCRDEEVRLCTPIGERLRAHRALFLSRKVRHTFAGYAASQLKRIEGHRKWLLDPPTGQPSRAAFGLPERTLLPADQLAAANAAVRKQIDSWELDLSGVPPSTILDVTDRVARAVAEIATALGYPGAETAKFVAGARKVGLDDNLVEIILREREYEAAHRHWRQYLEWRDKRNPARAALEAHHGYDTKHAAHLVRLLRMGGEILETGRVTVWRGAGGAGDAEELLAIRAGAWPYDDLVAWARAREGALDALAAASPLPRAPDRAALDALCVSLVEEGLAAA